MPSPPDDSQSPPNSLKQAAQKNPTLLGDPTSTKAETSETPNPDDASSSSRQKDGKQYSAAKNISKPQDTYASSAAPVMAPAPTEADTEQDEERSQGQGAAGGEGREETLKEKAERQLREGNPTQLGDPVSLKAETSERVPTREEEGAIGDGTDRSRKEEGREDDGGKAGERRRDSKL
ncbi:MAG: hypothetical protein Q9227_007079 [Pyrenula ochraceoflavens]